MSLFKRLFGRKAAPAPALAPFDAAIAPDAPFFAIGDLHGCYAQMLTLMDQMQARDADAPLVFVGDYVDRGEQSADVLRALFDRRDDDQVICITGNHEDMMLGFIDQPTAKGERWLRYGGMQTLASFGVGGVSPTAKGEALEDAAARLADAMGADMINWLRDLPSMWQSGNVTVVHAGADPAKPLFLQGAKTLAWGHADFDTVPRQDGTWVLHGHTIVDQATAANGRIAVDTGAYATGQLTAAYVTAGDVDFLQT